MEFKRTSHAVYDTSYQLVRCPKYRKRIFERSERLIKKISVECKYEVIEMEASIVHLHLMLSFPPLYSIDEVVRIIKSITVRQLFSESSSLKQRFWKGEIWEDGYFARTVGDRMTREVVEQYIEHHRNLKQGPAQLEFKLR